MDAEPSITAPPAQGNSLWHKATAPVTQGDLACAKLVTHHSGAFARCHRTHWPDVSYYRGSTEKEAFMNSNSSSPSVDTVIVGGGTAGLAAAAYVARAVNNPDKLQRLTSI